MKIAAISDIHTIPDGSDEPLLNTIKERVEEIEPDVFVIVGDISDQLTVLSDSLRRLKVKNCVNLYVAGNHDIWFEEDVGPGTLEKYSHEIGNLCMQTGFQHLPDLPYIDEEIAIVGSIGWYDYSFRREELDIPIENYEQKEYRGAVWYDIFRVDWGFTDYEATDLFNKKLQYDLEILPQDVRYVIYASHHLPFQNLTIYKDRLPWDFHSAFMGAKSTGEILSADHRVRLTISGHSHVRKMVVNGEIKSISVPLGYCRPSQETRSDFVRDAVAEINFDDGQVEVQNFVKGDLCEGQQYLSSRN